ncbi:hypothetical protein CR513_23417, partial [Mucuna pruriens]
MTITLDYVAYLIHLSITRTLCSNLVLSDDKVPNYVMDFLKVSFNQAYAHFQAKTFFAILRDVMSLHGMSLPHVTSTINLAWPTCIRQSIWHNT